jgi:capsule polysaccharide export protein KpsE/RkpR
MSATQTLPERPKNLAGLLPIINRWKYQVLGLTLLALVVSTVISVMLPNVYRSTTVFYPTNLAGLDPDRIIEGSRIEKFGTREDIDRITTLGMSQPLAEYIINKYQLYKDYHFQDMKDDASKQAVLDNFAGNLNIVQTERDAIELTFYSEDKNKAAAVANEIVEKIDLMTQELTMENRKKIMTIYKQRYDFVGKEFNELVDSLNKSRRKYAIFGLEREGRALSKNLIDTQTDLIKAKGELEVLSKSLSASDPKIISLKAQINGMEKALTALSKDHSGSTYNLEAYVNGVDDVNDLYSQVTDMRTRFSEARKSLDNARLGLTGKISTVYVVQKAYPAMKKAKPIRWLIVVSATLLTFMVSVIFVSLLELYKHEMRRSSL